MGTYLKTEPSNPDAGYHRYDIYNPFSDNYPNPYNSLGASHQQTSLRRNLRAEKVDTYEQLRREKQFLQKKQRQYHEILYGQSKINHLNSNTHLSSALDRQNHNPFLQGESKALKQLKIKHNQAKVQFYLSVQRQNQSKNNKIQQNQIYLNPLLSKTQFKSIIELKNLEDYRRIKQAQKIQKNTQIERKNLLNFEPQKSSVFGLFSFGIEDSKRLGLKISSKFSRTEEDQDLRITFNKNLKDSRNQGLVQMKRPPMIKKIKGERSSLQKIGMSGTQSPKTIKVKRKTFYLISL